MLNGAACTRLPQPNPFKILKKIESPVCGVYSQRLNDRCPYRAALLLEGRVPTTTQHRVNIPVHPATLIKERCSKIGA
jgi:hypothetical protein